MARAPNAALHAGGLLLEVDSAVVPLQVAVFEGRLPDLGRFSSDGWPRLRLRTRRGARVFRGSECRGGRGLGRVGVATDRKGGEERKGKGRSSKSHRSFP